MTSFSDPHVIAALVAKLAAVSILISNVEYLFARRILTDGGSPACVTPGSSAGGPDACWAASSPTPTCWS
jgi:hypothetical protein